MDVSENGGFSPQIIHFNKVFYYKPSILGYPYFWKHPYILQDLKTLHPNHLDMLEFARQLRDGELSRSDLKHPCCDWDPIAMEFQRKLYVMVGTNHLQAYQLVCIFDSISFEDEMWRQSSNWYPSKGQQVKNRKIAVGSFYKLVHNLGFIAGEFFHGSNPSKPSPGTSRNTGHGRT